MSLDPVGAFCLKVSTLLKEQGQAGNLKGRGVVQLDSGLELDILSLLSSSPNLQTLEQNYKSSEHMLLFLNFVKEMPENKKLKFGELLGPFLDKCKNSHEIEELLSEIRSIEPDDRENVLKLSQPFLEHCSTLNDIEELLSAINNVKNETAVIERAQLLLSSVGGDEIPGLLSKLSSIQKTIGSELVGPFLDKCTTYNEINDFFWAIRKIESKDPKSVFIGAMAALDQCKNGFDVVKALRESQQKMIGVLEELKNRAKNFFNKCEDDYEVGILLSEIEKIDTKDQIEILKQAEPFLDRCRGVNQVMQLLSAIRDITPNDRIAALESIRPFLDKLNDWWEVHKLIVFVKEISSEDRKVLLDLLKPIPQPEFFYILATIDQGNKERFLGKIQEFRNGNTLNVMTISLAGLLALDNWPRDARLLFQGLLVDEQTSLSFMTLLDQTLDSTDAVDVEVIAKNLTTYDLGLSEDHPLIQKAIEKMSLVDTPELKNPFEIYKRLKTVAATPTSFTLPAEEGLRFNPQKIRENAEAIALTKEDLPKDVTLKNWMSMCTVLKSKMEQHPQELKEIIGETEEERAPIIETLDSPYLQGLLRYGDQVSILQGQFAALIYNVLQLNHKVTEGKILSDREAALVVLAQAIQACGPGKADVITRAYLDSPFKIQKMNTLNSMMSAEQSRMLSFLTNFMQLYLVGKLVNASWLLHALGIGPEIEQESHQTLYLKNLIGSSVGLVDSVRFDPHTSVLYDKLLEIPREDALQAFYQKVTPHDAMKSLQEFVNQKLNEERSTLYQDLVAFLPESIPTDLVEYEEGLSLTEEGAKLLLQKIGFLEKA